MYIDFLNPENRTDDILLDDDILQFRDYVVASIDIEEILKHYNIDSAECKTGTFTHKARCPFYFHKEGQERTASLRIDAENKTFYCFGCNQCGDIVKFIEVLIGTPYVEVLKRLAVFVGFVASANKELGKTTGTLIKQVKKTNEKFLYQSGILIRDYINSLKGGEFYKTECAWADSILNKLDEYFGGIDKYDLVEAEKVYSSLRDVVGVRRACLKQ